ncbi:TPA: hypothetical protein KDZ97_005043 [Vibrio parahaemolyticus]|uniref:hypothetical protein n=1 Tax=Vibrio parahaemolyticus TaxID=670 RepID=UPI001B820DDD|nr:hypothetical protein [Vibrio parahaemolyticus]MDF5646698.1 hypothetical protein [Vibrio parahaemolyticus]MDF5666043.1 hypothetical protein [Vibrio parahaemolyticus]WKV19626.1 hypothetical protein [Vibrio parahaemolyticus]HBC3540463.1 hypothetical protein [Vibrio parahaemolyticus]HBC3816851.1 hypothetical protein [Vibrio parahaemolyticus]
MQDTFDSVTVIPTSEVSLPCRECGGHVQGVDGDWLNLDVGKPAKGIGWSYSVMECPSCGTTFMFNLAVVEQPLDDEIAIDNCHTFESERFVHLQKGDITILGHEWFGVNFQNPLGNYESQAQPAMAEYSFGPLKSRAQLKDLAQQFTDALIYRVQVDKLTSKD